MQPFSDASAGPSPARHGRKTPFGQLGPGLLRCRWAVAKLRRTQPVMQPCPRVPRPIVAGPVPAQADQPLIARLLQSPVILIRNLM